MAKTLTKAAKAAPKKAAPAAAKKAVPKKAAAAPKKAEPVVKKSAPAAKKAAPKKANAAFMAAVTPSDSLAAVVGSKPIPRTEIIKKIWDYIKKNGLQDKTNKRQINADAKLKPVFGKDQVSMFELAKIVGQHVK